MTEESENKIPHPILWSTINQGIPYPVKLSVLCFMMVKFIFSCPAMRWYKRNHFEFTQITMNNLSSFRRSDLLGAFERNPHLNLCQCWKHLKFTQIILNFTEITTNNMSASSRSVLLGAFESKSSFKPMSILKALVLRTQMRERCRIDGYSCTRLFVHRLTTWQISNVMMRSKPQFSCNYNISENWISKSSIWDIVTENNLMAKH